MELRPGGLRRRHELVRLLVGRPGEPVRPAGPGPGRLGAQYGIGVAGMIPCWE